MEISPVTLSLGRRGWTSAKARTKSVPFRQAGLLGKPEGITRIIVVVVGLAPGSLEFKTSRLMPVSKVAQAC
jgi:hypothetical protein